MYYYILSLQTAIDSHRHSDFRYAGGIIALSFILRNGHSNVDGIHHLIWAIPSRSCHIKIENFCRPAEHNEQLLQADFGSMASPRRPETL